MAMHSPVAIATFPTLNDAGGCRLVAWLNFRRASQEGSLRWRTASTRQLRPALYHEAGRFGGHGMIRHRIFPHALPPVGVTGRAGPLLHIQLSYATNPFRKDRLNVVLEPGVDAFSLS